MAAISFFLASSLALLRASASADFGVAGMAFLAPALRLEKENNLEVLSAYLYFNMLSGRSRLERKAKVGSKFRKTDRSLNVHEV